MTTPQLKRKTTTSDAMAKFTENDAELTKALIQLMSKTSGGTGNCGEESICQLFKEHTRGWTTFDGSLAHAKVVAFIAELKPRGDMSHGYRSCDSENPLDGFSDLASTSSTDNFRNFS
uniref:Uncharacterized protein n=1 Tax=Caenorhabditis japonica TaxID=281687 RepID=A0A8R1IG65_CAEJA